MKAISAAIQNALQAHPELTIESSPSDLKSLISLRPPSATVIKLEKHWGHSSSGVIPLVSDWLAAFLREDIDKGWRKFLNELPCPRTNGHDWTKKDWLGFAGGQFARFSAAHLAAYSDVYRYATDYLASQPQDPFSDRLSLHLPMAYIAQRGNEGWDEMVKHALNGYYRDHFTQMGPILC